MRLKPTYFNPVSAESHWPNVPWGGSSRSRALCSFTWGQLPGPEQKDGQRQTGPYQQQEPNKTMLLVTLNFK